MCTVGKIGETLCQESRRVLKQRSSETIKKLIKLRIFIDKPLQVKPFKADNNESRETKFCRKHRKSDNRLLIWLKIDRGNAQYFRSVKTSRQLTISEDELLRFLRKLITTHTNKRNLFHSAKEKWQYVLSERN